jgi:hypothetical protein
MSARLSWRCVLWGSGPALMLVHGLNRQLGTSHDTVVGFLRGAGCAIGRVRVRLSDASGVAIEEKSWFNDSTDAAALAEEVAHHIASSTSGRFDLEATLASRMRDSAIRAGASARVQDLVTQRRREAAAAMQ